MHTHSHKHTQFNTFTISGIRMGLTLKDSVLLKKDSDHKPKHTVIHSRGHGRRTRTETVLLCHVQE
jgi:hypothetical protein